MKTKLVSTILAIGLTLSVSMPCFANSTPFKDLDNTSAKEKILSLQEKGYVSGIADGIFSPDSDMTAAQGVQLIVKALGLNIDTIRFIKEPKASDYFSKADDNAWYAGTFIIASLNGLDLPKDLDPGKAWTKEEFTYYLVTAMEKKNNLPMINLVPVDIADADQMEVSYSGAIQRAISYGIIKLENGKFNPKEQITRADAAEEVYNALAYLDAHKAAVVD